MSETYPCYVLVREQEGTDEPVEIPTEDDGRIALESLQALYPDAIGLVYRSEKNTLRGLRVDNGYMVPPLDGWGEREYHINWCAAKPEPTNPDVPSTSSVAVGNTTHVNSNETDWNRMDAEISQNTQHACATSSNNEAVINNLTKLSIYGLTRNTPYCDVKNYFGQFGEVIECSVEMGEHNGESYNKGYGHVRFKDEASALRVLREPEHRIGLKRGQKKGHEKLENIKVRLDDPVRDLPDVILMLNIPFPTTDEFENYCKQFGEIMRSDVRRARNRLDGIIQFKDNKGIELMMKQKHIISGLEYRTIRKLPTDKFRNFHLHQDAKFDNNRKVQEDKVQRKKQKKLEKKQLRLLNKVKSKKGVHPPK